MVQVFFLSLFFVFVGLAVFYIYIVAFFTALDWAMNSESTFLALVVLGGMIAIPVATLITFADYIRSLGLLVRPH